MPGCQPTTFTWPSSSFQGTRCHLMTSLPSTPHSGLPSLFIRTRIDWWWGRGAGGGISAKQGIEIQPRSTGWNYGWLHNSSFSFQLVSRIFRPILIWMISDMNRETRHGLFQMSHASGVCENQINLVKVSFLLPRPQSGGLSFHEWLAHGSEQNWTKLRWILMPSCSWRNKDSEFAVAHMLLIELHTCSECFTEMTFSIILNCKLIVSVQSKQIEGKVHSHSHR